MIASRKLYNYLDYEARYRIQLSNYYKTLPWQSSQFALCRHQDAIFVIKCAGRRFKLYRLS